MGIHLLVQLTCHWERKVFKTLQFNFLCYLKCVNVRDSVLTLSKHDYNDSGLIPKLWTCPNIYGYSGSSWHNQQIDISDAMLSDWWLQENTSWWMGARIKRPFGPGWIHCYCNYQQYLSMAHSTFITGSGHYLTLLSLSGMSGKMIIK